MSPGIPMALVVMAVIVIIMVYAFWQDIPLGKFKRKKIQLRINTNDFIGNCSPEEVEHWFICEGKQKDCSKGVIVGSITTLKKICPGCGQPYCILACGNCGYLPCVDNKKENDGKPTNETLCSCGKKFSYIASKVCQPPMFS